MFPQRAKSFRGDMRSVLQCHQSQTDALGLGGEEEVEVTGDVGEGAHGALTTSPTGTLLDRYRRWHTGKVIQIRAGRRLNELSSVGVQRF